VIRDPCLFKLGVPSVISKPLSYCTIVAIGSLLAASDRTARGQVVSASFQQGVNGYNGTFDRRIADDGGAAEFNGADIPTYFVDGWVQADNSHDQQVLIRYDNIIGAGPGQIPANATILDAKFTVTTSAAGNAQTAGPFGVAGLLQSFDSNTTYFGSFTSATDFGSRGAFWKDGYSTRPVGGYGFTIPGIVSSANIHPIVQSWADGTPNHGLAIYAGAADTISAVSNTADGWSLNSSGHPNADVRPKLEVTYTTAPVQKRTFQHGVNNYTSDTMALVRSGTNALIEDTAAANAERTEDGLTLEQTFLDGVFFTLPDGTTSSPDDLALLKFGSVFGAGASQVPTDVPVAKAWVVMTTGDTSTAARSPGPWTAHTMLRPWDLTTLHSSFGAVDGLQVSDGDIGPALDTLQGQIDGSEQWFDVTSYLEGVRNGAADNGIAIQSGGTADGWQIHTNGSTVEGARPRLIVYSADLGITTPLAGDFNDDGIVDGTDFLEWQRGLGSEFDAADLADWKANYGQTAGGPQAAPTAGAVPEPSAAAIALAAAVGLIGSARRRIGRN
jgi:hypothetical protein